MPCWDLCQLFWNVGHFTSYVACERFLSRTFADEVYLSRYVRQEVVGKTVKNADKQPSTDFTHISDALLATYTRLLTFTGRITLVIRY